MTATGTGAALHYWRGDGYRRDTLALFLRSAAKMLPAAFGWPARSDARREHLLLLTPYFF